jgi:hypothetical protein
MDINSVQGTGTELTMSVPLIKTSRKGIRHENEIRTKDKPEQNPGCSCG